MTDDGGTRADPGTPADSGTNGDPGTSAETGTLADPGTAADSGTNGDPRPSAEPGTSADPGTPAEPGTSADPDRRPRVLIAALLLVMAAVAAGVLIVTLGRPEPGAREHALLAPRFEEIDASIDRIVAQAATLALAAREVLTEARALDPDGVDAAIATGSQASATISALREDLIKRREVLTRDVDVSQLRESDRTRIGTIDRALIGITQLPVSWVAVVAAASDPVDLVRSIQAHDARVADAAAAARADDLPRALELLEEARTRLVPARAVRDAAHEAGRDVSTLDELILRLDTYDTALERLWTLLSETQGQVTDGVRAAYAEVEAAQASLPLDQAALTLVVSDLAGPAITAHLLDIEQHRGLIAEAVAARPDASGG